MIKHGFKSTNDYKYIQLTTVNSITSAKPQTFQISLNCNKLYIWPTSFKNHTLPN